jgi:uncharacterized membrane protein
VSSGTAPAPRRGLTRVVALAAACAFAVVLWGGYDRGWRWTGFAADGNIWEWMHALVLPLALVAGPLWVRYGHRLERRHRAILAALVAGFALLVVAGYAFDLRWTGFPGYELWDWLSLLLLPLSVGLVPVWVEIADGLRRWHLVAAAALAAFFAVAIVGGYEGHWHWTGFPGNTLFDWIQLVIAPALLPFVLVPFVEAVLTPEDDDA